MKKTASSTLYLSLGIYFIIACLLSIIFGLIFDKATDFNYYIIMFALFFVNSLIIGGMLYFTIFKNRKYAKTRKRAIYIYAVGALVNIITYLAFFIESIVMINAVADPTGLTEVTVQKSSILVFKAFNVVGQTREIFNFAPIIFLVAAIATIVLWFYKRNNQVYVD